MPLSLFHFFYCFFSKKKSLLTRCKYKKKREETINRTSWFPPMMLELSSLTKTLLHCTIENLKEIFAIYLTFHLISDQNKMPWNSGDLLSDNGDCVRFMVSVYLMDEYRSLLFLPHLNNGMDQLFSITRKLF
jgi:hypothetical protein